MPGSSLPTVTFSVRNLWSDHSGRLLSTEPFFFHPQKESQGTLWAPQPLYNCGSEVGPITQLVLKPRTGGCPREWSIALWHPGSALRHLLPHKCPTNIQEGTDSLRWLQGSSATSSPKSLFWDPKESLLTFCPAFPPGPNKVKVTSGQTKGLMENRGGIFNTTAVPGSSCSRAISAPTSPTWPFPGLRP